MVKQLLLSGFPHEWTDEPLYYVVEDSALPVPTNLFILLTLSPLAKRK